MVTRAQVERWRALAIDADRDGGATFERYVTAAVGAVPAMADMLEQAMAWIRSAKAWTPDEQWREACALLAEWRGEGNDAES